MDALRARIHSDKEALADSLARVTKYKHCKNEAEAAFHASCAKLEHATINHAYLEHRLEMSQGIFYGLGLKAAPLDVICCIFTELQCAQCSR